MSDYDDLCQHVRREANKRTGAQGVMMLVIEKDNGATFVSQMEPHHFDFVPDMLEQVAKDMRATMQIDVVKGAIHGKS